MTGPAAVREALPEFFTLAPALTVHDPLAEFLGAAANGVLTYHYADAVRLAGHSCPTVAGTWLMVIAGVRALYGDDLAVRGDIEVFFADAADSGATGVMAAVAQLLTGAAAEGGFHGIAGRFSRKDLLFFDVPMSAAMGLRRRDNRRAVQVALDASVVPWSPEMRELMPLAASGRANEDQLQRFGALWQDRVRRMLTEHANDAQMIHVSDWTGGQGSQQI